MLLTYNKTIITNINKKGSIIKYAYPVRYVKTSDGSNSSNLEPY